MKDTVAKAHRCYQCHAVLDLTRERDGIIRCLYCGSDHRMSSARADEEARLHREKRIGGLIAPYVFAAVIGFGGYLAFRDFLWSPYDGRPAMMVGVLLLVLGVLSFRMPAAVGLAIVGIAGVLKPFVRPIGNGPYLGELSPMSESAFYYLIPGGIAAIVAFLFFSSMRIRELKPAFLALVPRVTVALTGVGGVVGAYYFIGDSIVDIAKVHSHQIATFDALSRKACRGELEVEVESQNEISLQNKKNGETPKNVLYVSCGRVPGMSELAKDPLLLDELSYFRYAASGRYRYLYRSANESFRGLFATMAAAQYLVVVKSDDTIHRATVVSVASGQGVGGAEVSGRGSEAGNRLKEKLNSASAAKYVPGSAAASPSPGSRAPETRVETEAVLSASYTYQSKIDRGSSLWIYGVVENTSASLIAKPKVIAVFLDAEGEEVGTAQGYGAFAPLAGERTPVLIIESEPPEFATIEYSAHARRPLGIRKASGISVTEHAVRSSGTRGKIEISGKVKNTGSVSARYVKVIMSVFDNSNVLIGLESVTTAENMLAPGQESRFLFLDRIDPSFKDSKHIELHVDAQAAAQ